MRAIQSLRDAELAIGEITNFIDSFRSKNLDISGRRVINASASKHGNDYVIRDEILGLVGDLQIKGIAGPPGPKGESGTAGLPVIDTTEIIMGNVDQTKRFRFEVDGYSLSNVTHVYSMPDDSTFLAGLAIDQIFTKRNTFQQPSGATLPAVVVKNDGTAVAGDVFQVQKTDGTAIFKVINQNDPGAGAANAIVSEHHYARLHNTYAIGSSAGLWNKAFIKEIELGFSGPGGLQGLIVFRNNVDATTTTLRAFDATTLEIVGDFRPGTDNSFELGDAVKMWATLYSRSAEFGRSLAVNGIISFFSSAVSGSAQLQGDNSSGTIGLALFNGPYYAGVDDTLDLGLTTKYWRKLYTNEVNLSNNKKIFFKDLAGTLRPTLWMDATNDFNIGIQQAVVSGGDLVLWGNGEALIELDWTATGNATLVPVSGKLIFLGTATIPFEVLQIKQIDIVSLGGGIATLHIWSPDNTKFIRQRMTDAGVSYQINWPASQGGADTFLKNDGSGNLTWATSSAGLPVVDTTSVVEGSVDPTKELRFEVDGFTTATVRVLTPQNADYTIAGINIAQTFTAEQTFSTNILAFPNITRNIGEPAVLFANIYTLNLFIGRASTHTGALSIYNSGGAGSLDIGFDAALMTVSQSIRATVDNNKSLGNSSFIWQTAYIGTMESGRSAALLGTINFHHNVTAGTAIMRTGNVTGGVDIETDAAFYQISDGSKDLGLATRRWKDVYAASFIARHLSINKIVLDATNFNIDLRDSGGTLEARISTSAGWAQINLLDGGVEKIFLDANNGGTPEIRIATNRVVTTRKTAVTKPTGGATIDAEARTAIDAIIDRLRVTGGHGLISD